MKLYEFEHLTDDEKEYYLDLAERVIKKASLCVSSSDELSAQLGIETRFFRRVMQSKIQSENKDD